MDYGKGMCMCCGRPLVEGEHLECIECHKARASRGYKNEAEKTLLQRMRDDLQKFHDEVVSTDEKLMDDDDCAVCRTIIGLDYLINGQE